MLVLTRLTEQEITIGDDIVIKVCRISRNRNGQQEVRLGITAPKDILIKRDDMSARTSKARELRNKIN